MPLARKLYRGCKVWAEVDEQGKLVEQRGLVTIRYRQEGTESYSARASEIQEIDPAALPEPRARRTGTTGRARGGRRRSSPDAEGVSSVAEARRGSGVGGAAGAGLPAAGGDAIEIYADGSCFGNPGPAGIGVLLEWRGRCKEVSRFLGEGTNNIAELTAIQVALEEVKNRRLPVRIHTDSAYAVGVLQEGWKARENRELVARVQALLREFCDVRLVKVRGHAGDPRNERVDQLARDAIARRA